MSFHSRCTSEGGIRSDCFDTMAFINNCTTPTLGLFLKFCGDSEEDIFSFSSDVILHKYQRYVSVEEKHPIVLLDSLYIISIARSEDSSL